ncbi:unnamed protein product [Lymnaea stagnalis]|uniref:Uncharacterized protein n=2 Tax=Lymnaea stagnalis TaxID=6523 RepID=A0AAV2HQ38_LYMST
MKISLLSVVVAVIIGLVGLCCAHVETRDVKELVGQQPLLFGRRGLTPNMNSLFFGKRSSVDSLLSLREVKHACSMLMTYIDNMETLVADDDSQM